DRKLCTASAAVVASMAKYDWPDEWPQLFSQLVDLLHTNNRDQTHAAMCVFSEWVNSDMSEQHIEQIGILLPELQRIFVSSSGYATSTRAMAIRVFSDCIEIISNMSSAQRAFVDTHAPPILKEWMGPILDMFKQPVVNDGTESNIPLKAECVKAVVKAMEGFPKHMLPYNASILEVLWLELKQLQNLFVHAFVYEGSEHSELATNMLMFCEEDEGNACSIDNYLLGIFEWLAKAVESKSMRKYFVTKSEDDASVVVPTPFLSQLCVSLMSYAQITTEMLEDWADDMDLFVADEDEEGYRFNVRVSVQELVQTLDMAFSQQLSAALGCAARERSEIAKQWRRDQNNNWWLVSEAMLWTIGLVAESIVEQYESGKLGDQFNLGTLFESDVWPLTQSASFPFGQGRAFVFASNFAKALPPNIATSFVAAACNAVADTQLHPAVRLSAVRATSNFCSDLPEDVAKPQQAAFINGLATVIPQLSEDSAHIALDALHAAIQVDQGVAASLEPIISQMAMGVWQKYPGDVLLTSIVIDIVEDMAGNSQASEAFARRALPIIGSAITQSTDGMVTSSGIDLLAGLVKGSSSPMPEGYTDAVFPSLMHVLSTSSDSEVLQSGQSCLKYFVQKDAERIAKWRDNNGVTGLEHIIRFVAVLLSPDASESAALFVGDLVAKIVQKCTSFIGGDILADLIQVVTARLATARTSSFCSSLIPLYAQLFTQHPAEVVDLLNKMNFGSQSGLHIVLSAWFKNYLDVQGYYSRKVSAVALTRLFLLGDPRVNDFVTQGDLVPNAANNGKIVTRSISRVNPDQYTQIPAAAKIVKLLLAEVDMDVESMFARASGAGLNAVVDNVDLGNDDGSDDEDWEDDGDYASQGGPGAVDKYSYLSGLVDTAIDLDEEDDDDDDEDVLADPIYSQDLNEALGSFMRQVVQSNQNGFHERIEPTLTAKEKDIL
ncbi:armadillo-type protein, partial [Coemansia spiralis]